MEVMNKTVVLRVPASFRDGGREMMSDKLFQFQDWVVSSSRFLSSYLHIYISTYLNIYISTYLRIIYNSRPELRGSLGPGPDRQLRPARPALQAGQDLPDRDRQGNVSLVCLYIYLLKVSSLNIVKKSFVDTSIRLPIAARTSCHQMWRFSLCCFAFSR